MNETIKLTELLYELSVNGILRMLADRVGVSSLATVALLPGAIAPLSFVLILRFDKSIRWWFINNNERLEPYPLLFKDDLNPVTAQVLIGREGVVQAPLRPTGNVRLDGRTYVVNPEISQSLEYVGRSGC